MSPEPAEGERRAVSGYRHQYLVGATLILNRLNIRQLEWIRIADPEAGRVDDLQIATTARVDAYQVKWSQYGGTITLGDLCSKAKDSKLSLFGQLADGWQRLRVLHPQRQVVVHLVTNNRASTFPQGMPPVDNRPSPYHFAAFLEQSWRPARINRKIETTGVWSPTWDAIRASTGLSAEEFVAFVADCSLDFGTSPPEEHPDVIALVELLFAEVASTERIIELSHDELLKRLGWTRRYEYRNLHEFPSPPFLYRSIETTASSLESAIMGTLNNGYIGVFGSPGSGKSTMLSQTLRSLPVRLIPYYAYVPEAQDPTILRGESTNFLHDITLRLQNAGIGLNQRPDPSDRSALLELLHQQLQNLGEDFQNTGTKSVILVDGLDHIAREQQPERSLIKDLPLPEALPLGVFIVIGSQTDDLPDLPSRVQHTLRESDRRIKMESLSPSDVDMITVAALPSLTPEDRRRILELTSGHPLALIYLLKQLQRAVDEDIRSRLLADAVQFEGDIEVQYSAHWRMIENDHDLVHALGLLARVRGPISMKWVSTWLDERILEKLRRLFVQYFHEEGEANWRFFHNSFRLFLEAQTAEPLPGQSPEQRHRAYHSELAWRYKDSPAPWKWEVIYHLYSAYEFDKVVRTATFGWFLDQVRNLRPIGGIQSDSRLALKAAGEILDLNAIIRLTLVGAILEQRSWTLEKSLLPDLLLEAGEPFKAADHLRDGNRLRVEAKQALRLSVRLAEAGYQKEGRTLFELAEPLEFLSGRLIPDDHTRPQDLWDLLGEWVRSATFFRKVNDVIQLVRRVSIQSSPWREVDEEHESQRLQNWLILEGASACCERRDWDSWQSLYEAFYKVGDVQFRFFTLLRATRQALEQEDGDRARALLIEVIEGFQPEKMESANQSYQFTEAKIVIAEMALQLLQDESVAQAWLADVVSIPLEDRGLRREGDPSLVELRFRLASVKYLMGDDRDPKALQEEAEAHTSFGDYVGDDEKAGYRQFALATYCLARLWAWSHLGSPQTPAAFMQQVDWILDLISRGWKSSSPSFRMNLAASRPEILEIIVETAAEQGSEVLNALSKVMEVCWVDLNEAEGWPISLQRDAATYIARVAGDRAWVAAQLRRIEPNMLDELDPYRRVEACQEQAKAWLTLGDTHAALSTLHRMCEVAGGIQSDDDYQLPVWVRWLGRKNAVEPDAARRRIRLMLRRILAVEGSASGVVDASEELLGVVFHWSPRRAVSLLKRLLENHTIGHQSAVSRLLKEALTARQPPIKEVLYTFSDLIMSLGSGTEPDLIEAVINQIGNQFGREAARDAGELLARRISVDAPASNRHNWNQALGKALNSFGYTITSVGLEENDLVDPQPSRETEIDRTLHLKGGEQLSIDQVVARVHSVDDLRSIFEAEDRESTHFFNWGEIITRLAPNLTTLAEIIDIEELVTARLRDNSLREHELARGLTALSSRCLELKDTGKAWCLAQMALQKTSPSGWDPYYDGGVRHAVIRQLIAIDSLKARDQILRLYADDLGDRFPAPSRILIHLDDVLGLFAEEIPIADTWSEIESYLDDLFFGYSVVPRPELEAPLDEDLESSNEDTPEHAVADLILLYLDHPSFSVAQAAVRAASASLMDGSKPVTLALLEAMRGTNQACERALMILDALSMEKPEIFEPFIKSLEQIRSSPDFTNRLIAIRVLSRLTGVSITPLSVKRDVSAIYKLHLPKLSHYDTLENLRSDGGPVIVGDPARMLRPFDIEFREIARIAGISEDAVLLRGLEHFRTLELDRTWLQGDSPMTWSRLAAFLDQIGLRFTTNKPHIAPARCALAHVIAELYDGEYLSGEALPTLVMMLLRHDPAFILRHPDRRPGFISPIGGLTAEHGYLGHIPDGWSDKCEDSLSLLIPGTPDGRVVVGEWSRLRRLEDNCPAEERAALIRAVQPELFWNGIEPEKGHPPFHRLLKVQFNAYLTQCAPGDHLVVAHDPFDFETPGARWLALNPSIGLKMGWQPDRSGWFRWIDQKGEVVAESIWWADGLVDSHNSFLHDEVGCGWLVVMTKKGFEEVKNRAGQLCRGGVVRREIGWNQSNGKHHAACILSL